jgi:ribosomal protein L34E
MVVGGMEKERERPVTQLILILRNGIFIFPVTHIVILWLRKIHAMEKCLICNDFVSDVPGGRKYADNMNPRKE